MLDIDPHDLAAVLLPICLYAARKAADTLPDYEYAPARAALEHELLGITKQGEAIASMELRLLHGYGDWRTVTEPQIAALNDVVAAAFQECAALLTNGAGISSGEPGG